MVLAGIIDSVTESKRLQFTEVKDLLHKFRDGTITNRDGCSMEWSESFVQIRDSNGEFICSFDFSNVSDVQFYEG